MRLSSIVLTSLVAAVAIAAAGQSNRSSVDPSSTPAAASTAKPANSAPGLQPRNPRYRLRKGDTFDVEFAFSPEFNQTVPVQPDGYVTLKSVGSIFVEGQTIPELTETIKKAYAKILHDPVVTIALKDFEKPYFIAAGQVTRPGKYDLRSDLTLTQAIAIAGGFTDASKHSQVVLFRPAANGMTEARLLDVKRMLNSRDLSEDVRLRPGDMLYVPTSRMSKIRRYLPNSSMGVYANPVPTW